MPLTPTGRFVVARLHGRQRLAADPAAVLDIAQLDRHLLDTYTRLQGMADARTVAVFEYAHPLRAARRRDIFN